MQIKTSAAISAPATATWMVFGDGFGRWSEWSEDIRASSLNGSLAVGVIRTNETGIGVLTQELTRFDPKTRSLTYEIRSGMPAPIRSARNEWTIEASGHDRCRIVGRATFRLAWWAVPLMPLLRRKMARSLETFAAELAVHVEQGA